MFLARTPEGAAVHAAPGAVGFCPCCKADLQPKWGDIVTWHWAHRAGDCDPWAEPDSAWHLSWQSLWPDECREVAMGPHRADVKTALGRVIEFQHSTISPAEIKEREEFYGKNMVWVFDVVDAVQRERLCTKPKEGYKTFRWMHPKKSLASCMRPVYLDFGDGTLLHMKRLYTDTPCKGWGYETTVVQFLKENAGTGTPVQRRLFGEMV